MSEQQEQQEQQQDQPTNGGGAAAVAATNLPEARKAPLAIGTKGIEVKNWDDLWRFSVTISRSDLAPKDYRGKPENCLVAIQYGMELGIAPMQALQNIAVVNGRPSIFGDLAMALVEASGLCADKDEHFEGEPGKDDFTAVCVTTRRGRKPYRTEFSVADAKTAGLWGKQGPWQTNPKRMLQMRARGFNLRDNFPDVLKGMLLAEEVIDITPDPEPAPEPEKMGGLLARLNAATGRVTEGAPKAEPEKTEAAENAPATEEPETTDTSDVILAINKLGEEIDEKTGRAGAGFAAMRKIAGQENLDGLCADRLAEIWAAMKVALDKAEAPKPAEGKQSGQRELI